MQLTLQIVITDESGSSRTEELMTIQKSGETRNDIGLSVSESKLLLNTVQQSVVQLQTNILNTISGALTALLRAESKANRKYGTGRCLALFRYPGFGCTGAVVKRVIQRQSVCSATGPAIILTRH